ncbi:hypothetical protein F503_06017 [Ophiostoma piceae UAMH 11346]|uniref:Uncharacterized protein n=1 Tax=Ophiostoma piceae (strain UAMH 11346) TaxID=1262450 RepID=S3CDB3_OPHP1|nr:hypothetical protein F503_06017 [Ophiostoma piceae UAMH 11346]
MAVLSRKALLVLFFHLLAVTGGLQGVMAAAVPRVTPLADNTTSLAVSTAVPSSVPTSFVSTPTHAATAALVPDYGTSATEAPTPTEAPEFSDDAIMAAAITIPVPVISIQSWAINPSLRITWDFDHEHKTSKVSKESSNISVNGGKGVPAPKQGSWPAGMPRVSTPGEGSKAPSVHVGSGPDANGYTPPVYKGPVHGTEFSNHLAEADPDVLNSLVSTEPQASSRWKTWKDLWGTKEPQTVSTGEIGESAKFHPPATQIDRSGDDDATSAFGGPEEARFDPKSINRVQPPSIGGGSSQQGGSSEHGYTGTSTVTTKDGYKITEGDTNVETKSHGDTETGSYTGLGAAEYNKAKKLLDYFQHGKKPLTLASAMEVAASTEADDVAPSVQEIPFEDLNKTSSKLVPRGVVKHMMDVPVVKDNKTTTPLEIVKHMMEDPASKNRGLKKVLEVIYNQLNKTSPKTSSRDITKHMMEVPVADTHSGDSDNGVVKKIMEVPVVDTHSGDSDNGVVKKIMEVPVGSDDTKWSKAVPRGITKHMWEAPVPEDAQPTTLHTVTRPRTVAHPSSDASTPATTSAPEFYPIEDYYHRYMKRGGEEGVTFTFHAHEAAKTWSTSSATATQDSSSHKQSFPNDPEGVHYRDSDDKAKQLSDEMEDSPVFDDPSADDDTNEEGHDDLKDIKDEAEEMSQEIDDEFKDEFGRN